MAKKKLKKLRRLQRGVAVQTESAIPMIIACEEPLEHAIQVLFVATKSRPKKGRKPLIMHSLRVAFKLMSQGYGLNVVLGGLLHDLLEKSLMSPQQVMRHFGLEVASTVQATTNDLRIRDPIARYADSVARCAVVGEGALLARCADLIDNCERALALGLKPRMPKLREKVQLLLQVCREEDLESPLLGELKSLQNKLRRYR
ncbi:MAG: HD domain-containing protein [Deltaproteobacteria bacterium]|nr:HD domain-containing protein [Deltaproteobacteria bacterium]